MPKVTKKEVLDIARISRIELYEDEVDTMVDQLASVLTYAARVNEVAGAQQQQLPHAVNVFRPDQSRPCDAQRILKEGPDVEADYFVVPAILEHE
jgi:aspartyl-tRNA(Asn)/glutamyl-tRNA(Gln) amidotransferase subunit C